MVLVKAFPELAGWGQTAAHGYRSQLAFKALQRYIPHDTVSDNGVSRN
jgi:hypothetical protein